MSKRWYALYTDQRQELKAAQRVTGRLGFPTYVPMQTEYEMHGQWEVPVQVGVLFPRYIFALFDAKAGRDDWGKIIFDERIPVIDVLRDISRNPVPIPYRVMRAIRWRDRPKSRRKAEPKFKKDEKVRVLSGPFSEFTGLVEGSAKQRVKVLLSIFGRETPVEVDEQDLRAIA